MQRRPEDVAALVNAIVVLFGPPLLMVAGSLPGRTQTLSIAIYDADAAGEDRTAHFLVLVSSLICVIVLVASSRLFRTGYMRARAG